MPPQAEEDVAREFRLGEAPPVPFCSNAVTTSQFTCLTFLPKFLLFAFSKLANFYFLVVSVLQIIPATSQTQGLPTILPMLMLMVSIEGILAALEDCRRHDADDVANNSPVQIWDSAHKQFVQSTWAQLKVGDVVKLVQGEQLPADVAVIGAHEPEPELPTGECYVETKSLDGETSLKQKEALEITSSKIKCDADIANIHGVFSAEAPNVHLHTFTGTFKTSTGVKQEIVVPVPVESVLLRGSSLQLTEYVYAVVIFTGHDTKVMMNSRTPEIKRSTIDAMINRLIVFVLLAMFTCCAIGGIGGAVFDFQHDADAWYLGVYHDPSTATLHFGNYTLDAVLDFFAYWVLMSSFVSVSLIVSMVLVKACQVYFMQSNLEMYSAVTDTPMTVRTMNLNDELGVISFILSDKTGTLTDNIMQFRKCTVRGRIYGRGQTEIGRARLRRLNQDTSPKEEEPAAVSSTASKHVDFEDPAFFNAMTGKLGQQHQEECTAFVRALAVCHSCIRMNTDSKSSEHEPGEEPLGELSAASPDELALVEAGAFFGHVFTKKAKKKMQVQVGSNMFHKYELLNELEFTSERKRSSMIVKDCQTGTIELMCKGADSEMWKRLASSESSELLKETKAALKEQANDGLRTLVYGSKVIDEQVYHAWNEEYTAACVDLEEMEKRKKKQPNRIEELMDTVESGLSMLGTSALEDKLQDGVPATIAKCLDAGISVWMLTGDKQETAINIGFACSFLDEFTDFLVLNNDDSAEPEALKKRLEGYVRVIDRRKAEQDSTMRHALVIDGDTLVLAMQETCLPVFVELIQLLDAVVANRCSPLQKASTVTMVRSELPAARTLSIGDGANDVAMLMAAHVGIGISGQEGLQAVNNSDFAIARFRFLQDLLFVHGKNNYLNMSILVVYMFYKNIMIVMAPFLYTVSYAGFSGQKFEPEYALQLFNAVWTFLPILFLGVLDQQVPRRIAKLVPRLYSVGIQHGAFNARVMTAWALTALLEAVFLTYFVVYCMGNNGPDGTGVGLWGLGLVVMTAALMVANLKLFAHQSAWNWIQLVILFGSMLSWWPMAYLGSSTAVTTNTFTHVLAEGQLGVFQVLNGLPAFWLTLLLVVAVPSLADMARAHAPRLSQPDLQYVVAKAALDGKSDADIVAAANTVPIKKVVFKSSAPEELLSDREIDLRETADANDFLTLIRNAKKTCCSIEEHVMQHTIPEGELPRASVSVDEISQSDFTPRQTQGRPPAWFSQTGKSVDPGAVEVELTEDPQSDIAKPIEASVGVPTSVENPLGQSQRVSSPREVAHTSS